jgi:hypothetical protein
MLTHPYIGLIVDYYPSPSERLPAIVTEVHGNEPGIRPELDLWVFGKEIDLFKKIRPVDKQSAIKTELFDVANCWGYAHEFAILQEADHDEMTELGTQSNIHVGQISGITSYEY